MCESLTSDTVMLEGTVEHHACGASQSPCERSVLCLGVAEALEDSLTAVADPDGSPAAGTLLVFCMAKAPSLPAMIVPYHTRDKI